MNDETMRPLDYYRQQCTLGCIQEDSQQLAVLDQFERIYAALSHERQIRHSLFGRLRKPQNVEGLYLWGGVGIGKTFLMDCFFHCIPFPEKIRIHFHEFMRWLHHELTQYQGQKNPLTIIAKQLAKKTMLLCFDELVVKDITDAMLLARFFTEIMAQGICLVATSNIMPDDLYKTDCNVNYFYPHRFIKRHTHVLHADQNRLSIKTFTICWYFYTPNVSIAGHGKSFALLTHDAPSCSQPIAICLYTIKQAGDIIWFDFNIICGITQSA